MIAVMDHGKKNVLGIEVTAIDYAGAVEKILATARTGQPLSVSALAVHGVMTGVLDSRQRFRLNHLDMIVPDGQPVRWALNWLHGTGLADRVYGPTLTLEVCRAAAGEGLPIYLYGSRHEVLEKLARNLTDRFPGLVVAGMEPSRFRCLSEREDQEVDAAIGKSGARLVFVGLGCPRQEVWVYEHRDRLSMPLLAVGAAFDFHAGTLPQAPPSWQRWGLEWLFRLLREPKRLWRRYLFLNPLYLTLLFLQWSRLWVPEPKRSSPPEPLRYG